VPKKEASQKPSSPRFTFSEVGRDFFFLTYNVGMSQDQHRDRLTVMMAKELARAVKYQPATEHRFIAPTNIEVKHFQQDDTTILCLVLESEPTGRVGYIVPFIPGAPAVAYSMALLSWVDEHQQFRTVRKHRREIERLVVKEAYTVAGKLANDIVENVEVAKVIQTPHTDEEIETNLVSWFGLTERNCERGWVADWNNREQLTEGARKDLLEYIFMDLDDRSLLTSEVEAALPLILKV
jgi:F0F1-type ATP synthase delta subunit